MTRKYKLGAVFVLLGLGLITNSVLAADPFGLSAVGNSLGGTFTTSDPRIIITKIIQIILSFLGLVSLVLIMWSGFIWMTSNGDSQKIEQAKKILRNAIIGLVIILSAWGIATFIISKLTGAAGSGGSTINAQGGNLNGQGLGAIGACSVSSVYPENGKKDVPRNSVIMVTFKEQVKLDSVCINNSGDSCLCNKTDCRKINPEVIRLYKSDLGDACSNSSCPEISSNITDVIVSASSDNKTLVLIPASLLGNSDGNSSYSIKFTDEIKKGDNSSMFKGCSSDFLEWSFMVNSTLDLIPPLVSSNGSFPSPDNEKDIYSNIIPAQPASASIKVNDCPLIFSPAKISKVNPAVIQSTINYHGSVSKFKISVPAENVNKAQLFDDKNNLLGIADFDGSGEVKFPNYISIKVGAHPAGSLWEVDVAPEQLADTLTVNGETYVFASTGENNNIIVPKKCDQEEQAFNIAAKLSGSSDFEVITRAAGEGVDINLGKVAEFKEGQAPKLLLKAKVAGASGNMINLSTSNPLSLEINPFKGGIDRQETHTTRDKKDQPMNSIIQIKFNEALNPLTVSGPASDVSSYIQVVNANSSSSQSGASCNSDAQCRSYKCENNICVGNYLGGKFVLSSGYKVLEFISDKECGVNGCGEKIYCLPENSHLTVELKAANLKNCESDNDCLSFSPFKSCLNADLLGYKTCQDNNKNNYPLARLDALDGIVDAAVNSLDGDRSTISDGPADFYNDNFDLATNNNKKDKYKWSFFISDKIALTPPKIDSILPTQGQSNISLSEPIQIKFNELMMVSSLQPGSILVDNGSSTVKHHLINLRSSVAQPLGFWISADNLDVDPLDGEPDITVANIFHSALSESITYKAQVGSGVKDIYQNCYKPSIGPSCLATEEKPSCCFSLPASSLDVDGNCF